MKKFTKTNKLINVIIMINVLKFYELLYCIFIKLIFYKISINCLVNKIIILN